MKYILKYPIVSIIIKVIVYSGMVSGVYAAIRFDALYPIEEGYFGEVSITEIAQEIILFSLFLFYLLFRSKNIVIKPVTNIISLFFLASLIRELNFLFDWWLYPVLLVIALMIWLTIRDHKKLDDAVSVFFSLPSSAWLLAGFIVTFVFSRLFGQSDFWRILYDDSSYRLAKAAVEEGTELLGNVLMLISAVELSLAGLSVNK